MLLLRLHSDYNPKQQLLQLFAAQDEIHSFLCHDIPRMGKMIWATLIGTLNLWRQTWQRLIKQLKPSWYSSACVAHDRELFLLWLYFVWYYNLYTFGQGNLNLFAIHLRYIKMYCYISFKPIWATWLMDHLVYFCHCLIVVCFLTRVE